MITYNGKKYDFEFTEEKVDALEQILDTSLLSMFQKQNAMIKRKEMETLFVNTLKEVGGQRVSTDDALEIFKAVKEQLGYAKIIQLLVVAFQRDCPFFFLAD